MKYLSYAWLIVRNVITLLVAWLLYSIAITQFEIIIVSLLLVVYAQLLSSFSGLGLGMILGDFKSTKQFLHTLQILKRNDAGFKEHQKLREIINDSEYSYDPLESLYYDDEDSKEEFKKLEDQMNKITVQMYISGTFTFLIYVLAVWKIITTVL